MKIRAQKQIIETILINLQPFLEKKDATQITSHLLFEANNDRCIIKSTDLEIGLEIATDKITTEVEGTFTAHGKKLLDIIKILRNEEVTLELIDDTLVIKQKHSKFKLPTFDPKNYPSFPSIEGKPKISLNSASLIKNLKKISPAIDSNNPKYELNGALINIKDHSTYLVATDTKRLALASIDSDSSQELSIIVPKKAILEIQKLFLDKIEIYFDETNLIITNDNYLFFTRLINGKYPDYEKILPKHTKYQITLPKKEMINAIKMITTISQEIQMTFTPSSIIFNSLSLDNIEAKTQIELDTKLEEEFVLSLNSRYLLDFISQTESDSFDIKFNETTLPFVVEDNNFCTIIMPII